MTNNHKKDPEDHPSETEKPKKSMHLEEDLDFTEIEHPSYEKLQENLTAAEQQAQANLDKALRVQAEFENFKRRSEQDLRKAHQYSIEKIIQDLIPIVDSLEHGLEIKMGGDESVAKFHEGMEMTLQMLRQVLMKYGVKILEPQEGEAFNPAYHEAMTIQSVSGMESNKIIKVFQKGYQLHERVIRPARVIVSKSQEN